MDKRKVIATIPDGVTSAAFSPDSKTLAAGRRKQGDERKVTLKLWDVATGKVKASLKGHTNGVSCVAFSSDGKTLVSGGSGVSESHERGEVRLWDLSTGKEKAALIGHTGPIFSVAFSPDGKLVASGSGEFASNGQAGDGDVKLWDAVTGREKAFLKGKSKKGLSVVMSVAFSPDGKTLASAHVYGDVVLWDVQSGKRMATLQKFNQKGTDEDINGTYCVAFSPDGNTLAAATVQGIKLWDVKTGKSVGGSNRPLATVWSVAFSKDGKTVASAGNLKVITIRDRSDDDPTIRLWEWITSKKADK